DKIVPSLALLLRNFDQSIGTLPRSAHGLFAAQRSVIHSALDFHPDNLNRSSYWQQIEHPVRGFAHRCKFRLAHTANSEDQFAQQIFLESAIVLSALRNEQAEFPRLRKTALAPHSLKISAGKLLRILWKKEV